MKKVWPGCLYLVIKIKTTVLVDRLIVAMVNKYNLYFTYNFVTVSNLDPILLMSVQTDVVGLVNSVS